MNVIIYLIFARSLPPSLLVLQVNQYSRPVSSGFPSFAVSFLSVCLSLHPIIPPVAFPYSSVGLAPSFHPCSLQYPSERRISFLSSFKMHRHYFRWVTNMPKQKKEYTRVLFLFTIIVTSACASFNFDN